MTNSPVKAALKASSLQHVAELPRLEPAWRLLQAQSRDATIFSTWQWNATAAQFSANPAGLYVLLLADADVPVALAPLAWRRVAGLRTLAFLGTCLFDYSRADFQDFLIRDGREDEAAAAFVRELSHLRGDWDFVWLQELPATSPLLTRLPALAREQGWTVRTKPASDVYRIALPPAWETYLEGLSANTRAALGRKTRKLLSEPGVSARRVEREEELGAAMEALFRLHNWRWRASRRRGLFPKRTIFSDERTEAFHRSLAQSLLAEDMLHLILLDAGGEVVGARYSFEFNGTKSFYASGFRPDGDWSKFSLGLVMDAFSIRDSIDRGLAYEDFMRGDGEYKRRYNPEVSFNQEILIFASKSAAIRFEAKQLVRAIGRLLRRGSRS